MIMLQVICAEVKVSAILVQQNILLSVADVLTLLFHIFFPTEIVKNYSAQRPKTACIINNAIAPLFLKHLTQEMIKESFGIAIDVSSIEAHTGILTLFRSSILVSFHLATQLIRFAHVLQCLSVSSLIDLTVVLKIMSTLLSPAVIQGLCMSRNELIKLYFYEGYEYSLIVCFLHLVHGISISIRQLKCVLKSNLLCRKISPTANNNITLTSLVMVRIRSLVYITHLHLSKGN